MKSVVFARIVSSTPLKEMIPLPCMVGESQVVASLDDDLFHRLTELYLADNR